MGRPAYRFYGPSNHGPFFRYLRYCMMREPESSIEVNACAMMAAYMCQWLGTSAPPIDSTVCLNVFILQLDDNEVTGYPGEGIRKVNYPLWWGF